MAKKRLGMRVKNWWKEKKPRISQAIIVCLSISGALGLILTIILAPTGYKIPYENLLNEMRTVSISVFATIIVALLFNQPKKPTIKDCPCQLHLGMMGIHHVYPSREKGSECESDLIREFKELHFRHLREEKPDPVKMIGVTLNLCFSDDSDIHKSISENLEKKSACFQVFVSSFNNSEINKRYSVKNHLESISFEKTKLFNKIKNSHERLESLKTNHPDNIKVEKYDFSPYATIIFINKSIYYMPNMLRLDNFDEFEDAGSPQRADTPEIALRLDRNSEFGEKLEDLFDVLWKHESAKPSGTDDTQTENA